MKTPRVSILLLGLWLGASVTILGVVGYAFPGIKLALEKNDKLRERAGFDPDDDEQRRQSTLFVLVGELNRAYFKGWNWAQVVLGGLASISVLFVRRRWATASVALAYAIVLVLAFYLAPLLTELGRELDFVPRSPPPPEQGEFRTLHKIYTGLEVLKTVLVAVALGSTFRSGGRGSA